MRLETGRSTSILANTATGLINSDVSYDARVLFLTVVALPSNGDHILVGDTELVSTAGSERGIWLQPASHLTLVGSRGGGSPIRISNFRFAAKQAGDGLSFMASRIPSGLDGSQDVSQIGTIRKTFSTIQSQLTSDSTKVIYALIQNHPLNSANIRVGIGSGNAVFTAGSQRGDELAPGDITEFFGSKNSNDGILDLSEIYGISNIPGSHAVSVFYIKAPPNLTN